MHFFLWKCLCEVLLINYVLTLDPVFKSILVLRLDKSVCLLNKPVCFTHANVLLSFVNETMYLLGNMSFFNIHVNRFVAWDDSPGANVISKCMLWVRGLVPLSEF